MTILDKVKTLIKQDLKHINTLFFAKIIKVNVCTCDIKPKFYYEFERREQKFKRDLPIIRDVPVLYPRGGNSLILMPIKEGDIVMVGCSQVALKRMLIDGTYVKADDYGVFSALDAVILGGTILGNECGELIYGVTDFEIPTNLTIVSDDEVIVDAPSIDFKDTIIKGGYTVKSGKVAGTSSAWTGVTFTTPFSGSADNIGIGISFENTATPQDFKSWYVKDITVNGFSVWYKEKNDLALTIRWIASNYGNV